jgi:hypothetical protein
MIYDFDFDGLLSLDAEFLAEAGIAGAYEELLPKLRAYVPNPAKIEEFIDNDAGTYSVKCGQKTYLIYNDKLEKELGRSWGLATVAFFAIINDQLAESTHRFYAVNDGNDLHGVFLTPAEAAREQELNADDRRSWPYLPIDEPEWYGMYH